MISVKNTYSENKRLKRELKVKTDELRDQTVTTKKEMAIFEK